MSLSRHNLDTIYRKMNLRAEILPAEIILVVKDYMVRIEALEEQIKEMQEECNACRAGMEEAPKTGPRAGRVSKKKVSPNRVQESGEG